MLQVEVDMERAGQTHGTVWNFESLYSKRAFRTACTWFNNLPSAYQTKVPYCLCPVLLQVQSKLFVLARILSYYNISLSGESAHFLSFRQRIANPFLPLFMFWFIGTYKIELVC